MTLDDAVADIRRRLTERESSFLESARCLIYGDPRSSYRKLLLAAGCEYADLSRMVRDAGLEKTLEKLKDDGVFVTLDEMRGAAPIIRGRLRIEPDESCFDNPCLMGKGIRAFTSGSRHRASRVLYDWNFFTIQAATERVLHEVHGVGDWPVALWMPGLPAISGIHNLFLHLKFRQSPEKWFSQIGGASAGNPLWNALLMSTLAAHAAFYGLRVPRPEKTDATQAVKVARWMADTLKKNGRCVLRVFASFAVRVAQAAIEHGLDLRGSVIFAGGEALTPRRREAIEKAGARVYARYAATETGLIGGACGRGDSPGEMHVYVDRLAVIEDGNNLFFTSLSPDFGKILLNAEIGDSGKLTRRACDCLFGLLGMDLFVSDVKSNQKLTAEGMAVTFADLSESLGSFVERLGGGPLDYQFWQDEASDGLENLTIAVHPRLGAFEEAELVRFVMEDLRRRHVGGEIASAFWERAKTIRVVRAEPRQSKGSKLLPVTVVKALK